MHAMARGRVGLLRPRWQMCVWPCECDGCVVARRNRISSSLSSHITIEPVCLVVTFVHAVQTLITAEMPEARARYTVLTTFRHGRACFFDEDRKSVVRDEPSTETLALVSANMFAPAAIPRTPVEVEMTALLLHHARHDRTGRSCFGWRPVLVEREAWPGPLPISLADALGEQVPLGINGDGHGTVQIDGFLANENQQCEFAPDSGNPAGFQKVHG